jgi:hypothetical protein
MKNKEFVVLIKDHHGFIENVFLASEEDAAIYCLSINIKNESIEEYNTETYKLFKETVLPLIKPYDFIEAQEAFMEISRNDSTIEDHRRFAYYQEVEKLSTKSIQDCLNSLNKFSSIMHEKNREDKFTVRLWDMHDGWIDLHDAIAVSKEEADKIWNRETKNGTRNTCYSDGDYYKIFPADTKMIYTPDYYYNDKDA